MKNYKAMEDKFVCSICGEEYNSLDKYLECVSKCVAEVKDMRKAEEKQKRLEEVNSALSKVKAAKAYYEEQLALFKEKYPEEYDMNFGVKNAYKNSDNDTKVKSNHKVEIDKLFIDPDVKYLAKLLGII